ncbi:hypothetical protein [Dyadobacter psychrotolerans]|uniref:Uncharacterized protein n=1 Tax=Dyadobacter psychrotolerans TaxID=2541721 RepID=A0A4R5DJ39_9BACT|nr:hypothetical protein [Dyadobacter psychrotolerans]TDE11990.1 hypothetical protein E0F88_23330 [Dyadobacter psychrotolerans]
MSNSLNSIALNQYAARFSTTVLNEVYRSQDIVTGAQLLKLTPVRQVNLGMLNRLFEQWKSNAESFRSVFFDFDNDEVKQALQAFMNTASQHIAVKRTDLEPLLLDSVKDALKLLFTPEVYFEEKIRLPADSEFTQEKAEQLVKYTHIHRAMGEALLQKLVESGSESVYQTQAISWVFEVKNNADLLDDRDPYLIQFSEIFPLNLSELLPKEEQKANVAPLKSESKSFFDAAFGESETVRPEPAAAPQRAEPGVAVLSEIVAKTNSTERESLNNRFKSNMPEPGEDKSYGTIPVKVESIAASIPLGQRFMFVNQLFSKNSEHFEKAIYELDMVKSYEEAQNLIWHRYASKYAWDVNGEAVTALLNIVKRKFS